MAGRLRLAGAALALGALAAGPLPAAAQVQGVTATEILLGSSMDLTGPVSAIGIPLKLGLEVAADKINEGGGVHGRRIRLVIDDNGYDPKRAVLNVQKLIGRDGVFGVVAVLGSAITQITTPIVTDRGLPMLFAAALTRTTFDPPRKLSFALLPGYDLGMSAATAYAHDTLGRRRFCMMYQDDESGETSLAGVEQRLKSYGLTLAEKTTYKRGATDFSAQFARMRAANCDAVMLGTIVREAAGAAIERAKIGWTVDLFANQAAVAQSTINLGKEAMEGFYGFSTYQPYVLARDLPEVRDATARYRAKAGTQNDPDDFFFVGYTAMMLFAEGARAAGANLTPDGLVAGLEAMKGFDTGTGYPPMTFAPGRRLGASRIYALQVKGGRWTMIREMEAASQ